MRLMPGWMEALMEGHWRGEARARDELLADLQLQMLLLNGGKQSMGIQVGKGILSGEAHCCPGLRVWVLPWTRGTRLS